MTPACPVCGEPSDDWPMDLCQDHWEAYTSATWWGTEAGAMVLPDEFDDEWLALAKAEYEKERA